jgi:L-ascorbate metabolism protein UlaG (beta-lactamase superfamily)
MGSKTLFLRPNVQVEPLFDSWYAWSYLIPPASEARNVTERHLKIMDSYISAPDVHAAAVHNPKMLGGPFIDHPADRVPEIDALRRRTIEERRELIELSKSLAVLDGLLRTKGRGFSLQPLYAEVPPRLRGYVELVYDLNNNPSFRILEALLYRSQYYVRKVQSLALSIITGDDRPFVLSTPRLESQDSLRLDISFDDETVDWLFRRKQCPCAWDEIRSRIGVTREREPFLRSLFTEEQPARYCPYRGSGVRWRYFGHACVLIETANVSILFDPVLSYTYEAHISRYTYGDLPEKIDFVVLTHNHQDHILFETLLQIRHKVGAFVVPRNGCGSLQDPSIRLLLQQVGCREVIDLDEFKTLEFDRGSIVGLPFLGEHADLNVRSKLGYLVQLGKHKLLFLADSCNVEPRMYEYIHGVIGDVDALFLGMECDGAPLTWLYGPLFTMKVDRAMDSSRRLSGSNYDQAIDIVNRFHCRNVYVYALGQEPWLNYVMSIKYSDQSRPIVESNRLIAECRSGGICAERLFGEKEILLED